MVTIVMEMIRTTTIATTPPIITLETGIALETDSAFTTNKQNSEQRCRDGVRNEFVSWCRHLLVSFLFHALTSLHPLHFIEMIFPLVIRASVDALCRDGTSEISRDPRTKRLQSRRESLARPSKHTNNNF